MRNHFYRTEITVRGRTRANEANRDDKPGVEGIGMQNRSVRRGCCRVCLQTLANRSRERRIYGEIFSRIYLEDRPPTTMTAKRELCADTRSQFNLPTTRLCLAVIISGLSVNVFHAYLPPAPLHPCSPTAKRTADTRFTRDRLRWAHTYTYTHDDDVRDRPFEDEIDRCRWLVLCQK